MLQNLWATYVYYEKKGCSLYDSLKSVTLIEELFPRLFLSRAIMGSVRGNSELTGVAQGYKVPEVFPGDSEVKCGGY